MSKMIKNETLPRAYTWHYESKLHCRNILTIRPKWRSNCLMYKTYIKPIEIRMSHRIFKSLVYLSFYNFLPRDRFIFNDAIRLLCYVVLWDQGVTIKVAIKIFDSVCGMCSQKIAALFCFALTHFPLQVVRISTFHNEAVIDGFLCLALALSLLSLFFYFWP